MLRACVCSAHTTLSVTRVAAKEEEEEERQEEGERAPEARPQVGRGGPVLAHHRSCQADAHHSEGQCIYLRHSTQRVSRALLTAACQGDLLVRGTPRMCGQSAGRKLCCALPPLLTLGGPLHKHVTSVLLQHAFLSGCCHLFCSFRILLEAVKEKCK